LFLPCFCESSAAILCEPFIKQTRANESSSPRDVLNLIRLFMTCPEVTLFRWKSVMDRGPGQYPPN
jgi:hypothetical protein